MTDKRYICPSAAQCPIGTDYILKVKHNKDHSLITVINGIASCSALEEKVKKTGEKDLFCIYTQLYNMLHELMPDKY